MKKTLTIIAAAAVLLAALCGISALTYTHSDDFTGDILPDGISINGVDCSGLDYDEAAEKLTEHWNEKHIHVVGKLGDTLADYTDFGCTYDIEEQLSSIKEDHLIAAGINHYLHIPFAVSIAMKVDKCGEDFADTVVSSDFLSRGNVTETKNAYVDIHDPEFPIIPEVYGNKVDSRAFLDDITRAITLGQFIFEFDENAYMSIPDVKSDDPEILKYQEFCKKYLSQKITYELGEESFTLTAEDLDSLMADDMSGKADDSKVAAFVQDMKEKYDIVGSEREFTSLTGKTFKVSGGDYGWLIDADAEAQQLTEDINSHKDVKREPVFQQRGNGEYSRSLQGIGDTYIDIDITKQYCVYFKNGAKAWESDCVTGCWAAGNSTPTGVYRINGKLRDITLTSGGKKKDPDYYESFVNYWIPFIGNSYGLHDASWRNSFGGDIYKYSGSHGCVNLPVAKAKKLYSIVDVGTIVIIHY